MRSTIRSFKRTNAPTYLLKYYVGPGGTVRASPFGEDSWADMGVIFNHRPNMARFGIGQATNGLHYLWDFYELSAGAMPYRTLAESWNVDQLLMKAIHCYEQ